MMDTTQQPHAPADATLPEGTPAPPALLSPQAFYEKLVQRPDIRELLRRLAQTTHAEGHPDGRP